MTKRKLHRQPQTLTILKIIGLILSLASLLYIIFFISPIKFQNFYYLPFFLALFVVMFFISNIIFNKIIPSIIIGLAINSILILRLFGIKDLINPILIVLLSATLIYFFTSKTFDDKLTSKSSSINKTKELNADIKTKNQ